MIIYPIHASDKVLLYCIYILLIDFLLLASCRLTAPVAVPLFPPLAAAAAAAKTFAAFPWSP